MDEMLAAPVAAYVAAVNADDADAVAACFAADAAVRDEGHFHTGRDEIRRWAAETAAAYRHTLAPTAAERQGEAQLVTVRVTGEFPGSPADMRFRFTLRGGEIAALEVA